MVERVCLSCQIVFKTKLSQVKYGLGKFCSRKCFTSSLRRGKEVECYICQKKVWRSPRYLKKSGSGLFFCSKNHSIIWKNQQRRGVSHPNWKGGQSSYRSRGVEEYGLVCFSGETCPLKNVEIPSFLFEVDHINGDHKDNRIGNLQVLCIWCHRLKTYGGNGVAVARYPVKVLGGAQVSYITQK